ncbi:MAG TPA: glutamate--tRNA ligase [Steroidobacteraceae bacterium]
MSSTKQMRLRFAPSPTGFLHVGGARTALFNWLLARKHNGVFVLRIEDTDRSRSSDEMTVAILEGLKWLGLDWDEGPYHQADGFDRHRRDAERMLASGAAYRCFCTQEEVEARKAAAPRESKEAFHYDRHCLLRVTPEESERRAAAGEPYAIRFRVPPGQTAWDDAVHGHTTFDNESIEDFIILRSNGTPIYNLAVVSDDIEHRITHVVRGDDHISNTPKQILIYRALGHEPPIFAHVPMILGPDGKRLSKRHGATAIGEYRERGILPDAMVNFLALLGWSPGNDDEILSRAEMIERFSLEGINKKSAVFDTAKLEWMNGQYLARMSAEELEPLVRELLPDDATGVASPWLRALIDLLKIRARTVKGIAEQAVPYLRDPVEYDPDAVAKQWKNPADAAEKIRKVREHLPGADAWTHDELEHAVRQLAEREGVGAGKLIHPLRVAVVGNSASPGIFDVMHLLGHERTLRRIDDALAYLARMK